MLSFTLIILCSILHKANCENVSLIKEKICKFDIKLPGMSMESLEKAMKCTVVEGKIIITHLTNDLCSLNFPLLKEVTDYVLLAFTSCSDTSLNVFPSLTVIRGYELIQGYSLIVYNNAWRYINFNSLRVIFGGNILVALNPFLCNVENIDWKYMNVNFNRADKNIKKNKFICSNSCNSSCPERFIESQKTFVCWSYNICQSICNNSCTSKGLYCHVENTTFCCHKQCLGGCYGESNSSCVACRNFSMNGHCVSKCPHNYYEFKGRRCVPLSECSKRKMFIIANQKKCVSECPLGLFVSISNTTKYCVNISSMAVNNKECGLLFLKSIKDLSQVENCYSAEKVIVSLQKGGRDISIKLKQVFQNLRIVKQFVQIMRSNYLESLSFLSPLLEIQGQTSIGLTNVTLDITANNMLSKLWTPDPNFKILSGSVRFLANKNLCKTLIHAFINEIGLQNSLFDKELIDFTNGQIAICDFVKLNLSVTDISPQDVLLSWKNIPTSYQVLSGLIYYRSMSNNMKTGDTSDAGCSSVMWSVIEAQCKNNKTGEKIESTSLWPQDNGAEYVCSISDLKPATNYQAYLEYRFIRQGSAAISNHVYFLTSTKMPTPPQIVESVSQAPDEIRLSWKPPLYPNGLITKYIIYYRKNSLLENSLKNEYLNVKYCESDYWGFKSRKSENVNKDESSKKSNLQQTSCNSNCNSCKKICDRNPFNPEELLEMNNFDAHMYSMMLVPRKEEYQYPTSTFKSKILVIPNNLTTSTVNKSTSIVPKYKSKANLFLENNSTLQQIEIPASELRNIYFHVITNLSYFTEYIIEIVACHQRENNGNFSMENLMRFSLIDCSNKASISTRTMENSSVDDIPYFSKGKYLNIEAINKKINVSWKAPKEVNGIVLLYRLNYRKDDEREVPLCIDGNSSNSFLIGGLKSGSYKFKIMAFTLAGEGKWSPEETFKYETPNDIDLKIIFISSFLPITVIVITICIVIFFWKKKQSYILTKNSHYFLNAQDEWNIEFNDVKRLLPIGKGNFGVVYSGHLRKLETPAKSVLGNVTFPMSVAVKTVSQAASIEDIAQFLSEACLMKQFLGYHIVHLLGIYVGNIQKENSLHPMVVMELMENGDLSNYLHQFAELSDKGMIDGKQFLLWAIQIADGMCYMACKRFVHRDLAARNCLIDSNLNIKIGDFGLARSINENDYYRKRGRAKAPVRWMAPESLQSAVYTTKTDVWSYGVVLYEISTLGSLPYSGMSHENVIEFVREGGKLELEDLKIPSALLDVMIWCWSFSDTDRPTFMQILEFLFPYSKNDHFKQVSFYHNGFSEFDQCYNCSKINSSNNGSNSFPLAGSQICKHTYKCKCSNSLFVCDLCCDHSETTFETQDILTLVSASEILQQHSNQ